MRTKLDLSTSKAVVMQWACGALLLGAMLGTTGCETTPSMDGNNMSTMCGDGVRAPTEPCDDGNMAGGDGCASDCTIESGWTCSATDGRCTKIDVCAASPCKNGGTCTASMDSYTCQCALTYEGPSCESCAPNLADCNGVVTDGCEVNLKSNAAHCNACNAPCPMGNICSKGTCQAPPTGQMPGVPIDTPEPHNPLAPWVADVNADGKLDVLVANAESGSTTSPSGSLSVFLGKGDATVQPELYYTGATLSSNAVVAADVDGDGWLDAITVDGQANLPTTNGSISVYRNKGKSAPGTFGAPTSFTTAAPGSVHLCAGDFDKDGKIDIATVSVVSNQVSVMLGNGAGGFAAPTLLSIQNTGGVQSTIACRDMNADGFPDIEVTSPASARLSILINQGNGSFGTPVPYTNSRNGQTAGLAFGDADGDGKLDILANGAAGAYLYFFKGNGDGTFASGVDSATGASAVANSALGVVAGDFNSDGKLDAYILYTATAGGVYPMTGKGNGTFTVGPLVNTGISPGLNAIAVADLNSDGYADLVLTNKGSATLTVIPNGL